MRPRTYAMVDNTFVQEVLKPKIAAAIEGATALEVAAQRAASALFSEFETSVLVRVYVSGPFGALPGPNRRFVEQLAAGAKVGSDLKEDTLVLSLLGTSGRSADWNDRRRSRGHVGIPFISTQFVESIPMISRMLAELGVGTRWIGKEQATDMIVKSIGKMAAVFYVPDAATFRDGHNRLVIPAQDFVSSMGVKSVFGFGGAYPNGSICTFLCFTAETIERQVAERFLSLTNVFKAATMPLAMADKLFSPDSVAA